MLKPVALILQFKHYISTCMHKVHWQVLYCTSKGGSRIVGFKDLIQLLSSNHHHMKIDKAQAGNAQEVMV